MAKREKERKTERESQPIFLLNEFINLANLCVCMWFKLNESVLASILLSLFSPAPFHSDSHRPAIQVDLSISHESNIGLREFDRFIRHRKLFSDYSFSFPILQSYLHCSSVSLSLSASLSLSRFSVYRNVQKLNLRFFLCWIRH